MVHTAPEPTVGLGCPGLLFSPPSARGGAVHANVYPSNGYPDLPQPWGWSSTHTQDRGGWGLASSLGRALREAPAEITKRPQLRRLCQA